MKNICHNFYRKIIFNASALHTWAVQPAYVGYKKTDILTGLLSCQIRIIIL